jgi:DNA-binding LytR/AlgR family response regulator
MLCISVCPISVSVEHRQNRYNAVDYLVKPIIFERFLTAINKAVKAGLLQRAVGDDGTTIYLKSGPQPYLVKLGELFYLEKDGNYMTVYVRGKHILIRENMNGVFDLVPAFDFIRVDKSYVVAIRHVTLIEADRLRVNDERIPVGSTTVRR